MKYITSNRGYTLLITLVLVVLLIMITTTFTMASMNQAKQVVKTDNQIVSGAYSEMGVEYSKETYQSFFLKTQNELYNLVRVNESWTNQQFNQAIINSKLSLLQSFTKTLYNKFNRVNNPIEIQIFNFSTNKFEKIATVNYINSTNMISYVNNNQFIIRSLGKEQATQKSIDITFTLPMNFGVTRTPETSKVTSDSVLNKFFNTFCIEQNKCVESRLKGNSGNDSITNDIFAKGTIQIAKIQNFTTPAYTLYSNDTIELKANQIRLNNFMLITDDLFFNFPASASGKLEIKNSTIIVNKLAFNNKVNARNVELENTKICFLSPPTNEQLEKLDWKSPTSPNYIVLSISNLNQFKTDCKINIDLSVSNNSFSTTKLEITKLIENIQYQ
ncbi:hypothetical protein ACFO0S_13145 [Chryseomicrobium palamuruense]|uniref:Type 4 fimbrial biogenesis protein PilX N-terminal domain-containing protein n=1 Tax=Chryseomicrobium palamuruense TaxID=682973 RepID=A0ABV8UXE9_9BACL